MNATLIERTRKLLLDLRPLALHSIRTLSDWRLHAKTIETLDALLADLDRARSEPQFIQHDDCVECPDCHGWNELGATECGVCAWPKWLTPKTETHTCPECKKRDADAERYLFIRDGMRDPGYSIWYDGKRLTLLELEGLDAHIDAAIAAAREGAK